MKITITSNYVDPDDQMIEFLVTAEIPAFKGVTTIYGDQYTFNDFANQILKFPFESKEPIIFEGYRYAGEPCLRIELILGEDTGLIDIILAIKDSESGNNAKFGDAPMETQALHDFARALLHADFTQLKTVEFDGRSYSEA